MLLFLHMEMKRLITLDVLMYVSCVWIYFFFFQAEDGIRYLTVTGVQTCALPICRDRVTGDGPRGALHVDHAGRAEAVRDRKSTRLNSSHSQISYAVFCLKKKKIRARRDDHDYLHREYRMTPVLMMSSSCTHTIRL